jgi:N-acetylglucosaminyl-diphospho-decaprenol L-rhamnosyltransferase
MSVLIVVVNYRVAHLTIECLRALSTQIHSVPAAHVAVCENGTPDDSAARLAAAIKSQGWQSWAALTAIYPNRGFTGGNNVILRAAMQSPDPPRYFLLLNADTVARPGALRALFDFMEAHPRVGIAGSRLEDPDGTPQCSAFRFITPLSELVGGLRLGAAARLLPRGVVAPPIPAAAGPTDWVSGASLIVRSDALRQIGLLDEDLYTYFDDVDLCWRARRAGWEVWYVPESRVVHLVGQTTGLTRAATRPNRRPAYWFQARRHYFLKTFGPLRTALADAGWLLGLAAWRARRVLQRKPDDDPPAFLWDSFRHSVFVTGVKSRPVCPALPRAPAPVAGS